MTDKKFHPVVIFLRNKLFYFARMQKRNIGQTFQRESPLDLILVQVYRHNPWLAEEEVA